MDNNPLKSLKGLSKIEITKRFKWDQLNINFENQYRLQVMQDLIASGYEV